MTPVEVLLRLLSACAVGAILGLDREAKHKPAGLRTLTMVSLASALFTVLGTSYAETSEIPGLDPLRVLQGIITGVGFLGAGVILQREQDGSVVGLTTASSIWIAAALGMGCGLGMWFPTLIGTGLAVLVLVVMHFFEGWIRSKTAS